MNNTLKTLNYISVDEVFWVRFTEQMISAGFKGLPKDVHFTVAFNKDSPDINFHVTRNTENPDKPKNEIFRITKELGKTMAEDLLKYFFAKTLERVDLMKIQRTNKVKPRFISQKRLDKSSFRASVLTEIDTVGTKTLKKNRNGIVKLYNNLAGEVEKISFDQTSFWKLYKTSPGIARISTRGIKSGILVTDDGALSIVLINGHWYSQKSNIPPAELIEGFLGKRIVDEILYRIKNGISIVERAASFTEILPLNEMIYLIKDATTRSYDLMRKLPNEIAS